MPGKKTTASRQFEEKKEEDLVFASMAPVGAFDGGYTLRKVLFRKGDDVQLNSSCDDTDDVWIGRICQIRTSPADPRNTLVKIRWYWSRNDIETYVKTFNRSQCAPYERILSDDYDYVSPYAFQEVVYVHEYNESSLDPPALGPRDLFVRTALLHRRKTLKPPLGVDTCLCQVAYNPFPTSVTTSPVEHDPMHFCPSLHCRKWYHVSCLKNTQGLLDNLPAATRDLRLLAVNPDEEVLYPTFSYFYEKESQEDVVYSSAVTLHEALTMLGRSPSILTHLPAALLTIAQLPIVRCPGAPAGFAIGNVADVVLARRLVYAAVQHNGAPSADPRVRSLVDACVAAQEKAAQCSFDLDFDFGFGFGSGFGDGAGSGVKDGAYVELLQRVCDELAVGEYATLAEPRVAYWEERVREYAQVGELFGGPAFVCPQCRGAI
ncbi:hypothetical protein C8Q78DRAFT_1068749 [Trametes maxima]|nr:hypothetical protein C8Q78DRAFT_1068749 [Trametes maxima]